ncbi:MotE family protein [Virgibacillus ainsalahensis]
MAKQKSDDKKTNPVLWFLFAVLIPIIVTIMVAFIVAAVAGVNVIDWAKEKGNNIPVLSSFVTTAEEENLQQEEEEEAVIADKDTEIHQLEQNVSDLESTIEQLEGEILRLENNSNNAEGAQEEQKEPGTLQEISGSFKDMDNEQAALIIGNLETEISVSILYELSNGVRGEILEAMDPEMAAELTQQFINSEE